MKTHAMYNRCNRGYTWTDVDHFVSVEKNETMTYAIEFSDDLP